MEDAYLEYLAWKSAQCYVAGMGREFGREWIHVYVRLSPFAVHLKLYQHCQLAIPQYKMRSLKKCKNIHINTAVSLETWSMAVEGLLRLGDSLNRGI